MSINIKPSHRGLLHKKLGIAKGKKISSKTINNKLKGASGKLKKELIFAKNAKKWKH